MILSLRTVVAQIRRFASTGPHCSATVVGVVVAVVAAIGVI